MAAKFPSPEYFAERRRRLLGAGNCVFGPHSRGADGTETMCRAHADKQKKQRSRKVLDRKKRAAREKKRRFGPAALRKTKTEISVGSKKMLREIAGARGLTMFKALEAIVAAEYERVVNPEAE